MNADAGASANVSNSGKQQSQSSSDSESSSSDGDEDRFMEFDSSDDNDGEKVMAQLQQNEEEMIDAQSLGHLSMSATTTKSKNSTVKQPLIKELSSHDFPIEESKGDGAVQVGKKRRF